MKTENALFGLSPPDTWKEEVTKLRKMTQGHPRPQKRRCSGLSLWKWRYSLERQIKKTPKTDSKDGRESDGLYETEEALLRVNACVCRCLYRHRVREGVFVYIVSLIRGRKGKENEDTAKHLYMTTAFHSEAGDIGGENPSRPHAHVDD